MKGKIIYVLIFILLYGCCKSKTEKKAYIYTNSKTYKFKKIKDLAKDSTLNEQKIRYYDYLYEKTL